MLQVLNGSGASSYVNFNRTVKCLAMTGKKLYCGCSGYSIQVTLFSYYNMQFLCSFVDNLCNIILIKTCYLVFTWISYHRFDIRSVNWWNPIHIIDRNLFKNVILNITLPAGGRLGQIDIKYILFWDQKATRETEYKCSLRSRWSSLLGWFFCWWNSRKGAL